MFGAPSWIVLRAIESIPYIVFTICFPRDDPTMDILEGALVLQDENHRIYSGHNNYLLFDVGVGNKKIRVHSNLGCINPFCRYDLKGRFNDDRTFRANSCSFKPSEPNYLLIKKFMSILKERDLKFPVNKWVELLNQWQTTKDINLFQTECLPIIQTYAEQYADVAFFCFPESYIFVQSFYQDNQVLYWPLNVCRGLEKILKESPYDLTFSAPYPEMDGLCVNLKQMKELCPETDDNKEQYNVCEAAEFFCFTPLGTISKDKITPSVLKVLQDKGFLRLVGDTVVLKRTYSTFENIKKMRLISVKTNADIYRWCKSHKEYNFVVNKKFLLDADLPVQYKLDTTKTNCLLNIHLWTVSDIEQVLDGIDLSSVCGIGCTDSIGNRRGYNVLHFLHSISPLVRSVGYKVVELTQIQKNKSACLVVQVGKNLFHNKIVEEIKIALSASHNRKITFTTDTPIDAVPYEFLRSVKNVNRTSYSPKDRVVLDGYKSLFIKAVVLDYVKATGKRKRQTQCKSTKEYKKGKKIVLSFSNGDTVDFKKLKKRINHWGVMSVDRVLGLREDVVVLFTVNFNTRIISSLMNCCKKLIIIVPKTSGFVDHSHWELEQFNNIK